MWHDHSAILGHGYIFVTTKVSTTPQYSKNMPRLKGPMGYQAYNIIKEPEMFINNRKSSSINQ